MTKSVLTAAIWLTLGVILGFAILWISEKRLLSGSDPAPVPSPATARIVSEPMLIAGLKAEIARLEARLANLDIRPDSSSRLPASGPAPDEHLALDARPRPLRPHAEKPARPAPLGELERLAAPAEYADDAVIEGTVLVELGGKPVSRFTLGVKSEDGVWARKEIHDPKGRFSWILEPGSTSIFVSAPGYDDWMCADLQLERGIVTRIQIRLSPARRLEGRAGDGTPDASRSLRHAS